MKFDDDAELDNSQVEDRRGISGGKVAAGGGVLGVIGLLVALVLGVDADDVGLSGDSVTDAAPAKAVEKSDCRTGADANTKDDCRITAVVNSLQNFWDSELDGYTPAKTVYFTGTVPTACGKGSSDDGPFYCPGDNKVYLDLTFFEELRTEYGASGGPFAQSYVVAHEYGHHVQNLLGTMDEADDDEGADSDSVKLELQADCYAGVWAKHATTTPQKSTGRPLISKLSRADINEGLDAAAAIGDDRLQKQYEGKVTPETWTHGSSAQRQKWFSTGYKTGDMDQCDTFGTR
ncbi:KPN_02809 family neutral zinc metallopeptidase [Peterkaempfera bronchialis]|uniref:Neutral zinc metallopeptidase n=1 Tax=Peterkaempfera bronchialis TaxID=2126346 RepID=A0A345T2M8_9ACTN|nr:neutral zinc metallopeptidase [Peterkaempfera bronchialis]AXI80233.1 hypothetical protein C7M71_025375 [Peterkaempfera bronchialis]